MNCAAFFILGLFWVAMGVLLALAASLLGGFGRPQIRKLRENHRELSEQCEKLMEHRLGLRIALELEAAAAAVAGIVLITCWFLQACAMPLWGRWITVTGIFLLVALSFPLTEQILSIPATARLLLCVHPIARPFAFLGMPFKRLEDAMDERDPDDQNTITTEDAIRSLVEEDTQTEDDADVLEDDLQLDEKRMLTGVMNLDGTLVHEIMTPRVDIDAIRQDATPAEAKAAITKSGHSRIPVFGKSIDAITGILYAKDLLDEVRAGGNDTIQPLVRPATFIPETKNVADLLKEFRSKHNHMAVVLDEYGGTSGIVTIEDILEEIVGEIEDEFDRNAPPPEAQPASDGSFVLDARTTIWEVNQTLDLEIPEDEGYDTLAGYVMTNLGRIPRTGEHVETPALEADILCASPRRLITLKVRRRLGKN